MGSGIGSLVGAAAGSFIPGVGTALGATLGGGIGGMIGGGGVGGGSNPNNKSTTNTLPNIPGYMQADYNSLYGDAKDIYNKDYPMYTGEGVAGFTPDQTNAFQGVRSMQGQYQPMYNSASNLAMMAGQGYQGGITQPELDQFMNPYQQNVIDIAKRQAQTSSDQQMMQMRAKSAGAGTYGGSREALMESTFQNNNLMNQNDMQMQGSAANYNQAITNIMANRQGMLNSSQGIANLATSRQNSGYKDLGALSAQGDQQQHFNQAQDTYNLQQFQAEQAYPQEQFNWYNQFLQSMMGKSTNQVGVNNPGTPSNLNTGLGIGSMIGSMSGQGGSSGFGGLSAGISSLFSGNGFMSGVNTYNAVGQSINNPANSSFFANGGLIRGGRGIARFADGGRVAPYSDFQGIEYINDHKFHPNTKNPDYYDNATNPPEIEYYKALLGSLDQGANSGLDQYLAKLTRKYPGYAMSNEFNTEDMLQPSKAPSYNGYYADHQDEDADRTMMGQELANGGLVGLRDTKTPFQRDLSSLSSYLKDILNTAKDYAAIPGEGLYDLVTSPFNGKVADYFTGSHTPTLADITDPEYNPATGGIDRIAKRPPSPVSPSVAVPKNDGLNYTPVPEHFYDKLTQSDTTTDPANMEALAPVAPPSDNLPEVRAGTDFNEPLFRFGATLLSTPGNSIMGIGKAATAYADAKDTEYNRSLALSKFRQDTAQANVTNSLNKEKVTSESNLQSAQAEKFRSENKMAIEQLKAETKMSQSEEHNLYALAQTYAQSGQFDDPMGQAISDMRKAKIQSAMSFIQNKVLLGKATSDEVKSTITRELVGRMYGEGDLTAEQAKGIIDTYLR